MGLREMKLPIQVHRAGKQQRYTLNFNLLDHKACSLNHKAYGRLKTHGPVFSPLTVFARIHGREICLDFNR